MINMNIALLGRGESLLDINKLKDKSIDICIICNTFMDELKNEDIWDFVKDKKIVHIVSKVGGAPLSKEMYQKLNMMHCVINRSKDEWVNYPNKKIIEGYNIDVGLIPIPESVINNAFGISQYVNTIPSTGFVGLAFGVFELNPDNVYIIGVDFYETPFMSTGRIWNRTSIKNLREKQMKDWLIQLVKKTPNVKYNILTRSSYRFDEPNVEFI